MRELFKLRRYEERANSGMSGIRDERARSRPFGRCEARYQLASGDFEVMTVAAGLASWLRDH
jgi:hypothetical protein